MDNEIKNEIVNAEGQVDNQISTLSMSPEDIQERLIQEIINCPTKEELEKHLALFNFAQTKNNALRTIKLNKLLEKVEDQMLERFDKRPDQMSNQDLLAYLQAVSNQIERARKSTKEEQAIQQSTPITIKDSEVVIGPTLSRESKEKVTDFINEVLKQLKDKGLDENQEPIIPEDSDPKVD